MKDVKVGISVRDRKKELIYASHVIFIYDSLSDGNELQFNSLSNKSIPSTYSLSEGIFRR